jgi:hypothetical protein
MEKPKGAKCQISRKFITKNAAKVKHPNIEHTYLPVYV